MTSGWETFQELVKAKMRKVYLETVVDHSLNPRNVGNMDDADGFAQITGPCGDTMEMLAQGVVLGNKKGQPSLPRLPLKKARLTLQLRAVITLFFAPALYPLPFINSPQLAGTIA